MRISKTAHYLAGVGRISLLAGIPLLAAPQVAMADDWVSGVLDTSAQNVGEEQAGKPTGDSVANTIKSVSGWIIGIAIVLFVLKVIMTAIDRILFDRDSSIVSRSGNTNYFENSVLVGIPIIGAYPPPESRPNDPYADKSKKGYTWKDIWILFFVQLLIAVGSWFFVNLVVDLLAGLLGKVSSE